MFKPKLTLPECDELAILVNGVTMTDSKDKTIFTVNAKIEEGTYKGLKVRMLFVFSGHNRDARTAFKLESLPIQAGCKPFFCANEKDETQAYCKWLNDELEGKKIVLNEVFTYKPGDREEGVAIAARFINRHLNS